MNPKIEEGLKKAKHLEELDKQLRTVEELERDDKQFNATIKELRDLIKQKRIQ